MSYLVIAWQGERPVWLGDLEQAAPDDWTIALRADGLTVAHGGLCPPPVRAIAGGVLIGRLHERAGAVTPIGRRPARAMAEHLCATAWGGYVAVLGDGPGGSWSVLRCPSGGLDALAWRFGEALLIADDLPAWLGRWLPPGLGVDWGRLGAILADPAMASGALALSRVQSIAPGELWSVRDGAAPIWRPAHVARRRDSGGGQAEKRLRAVVDEVVGAQAGTRTLIELSGGLDSAIVASALKGRDVVAVNYFSRELGADERPFARETALRLGLELIEIEKPPPAFDLAALEEVATGARPALNALDFEHDRDMARRCRELGADTLMTGQGGDHVFFQAPSALIAADALPGAIRPALLAVLARRTGRSAWSVLREALGARLGALGIKARPQHVSQAAWDQTVQAGVHPWLADAAGLPPAKALQVACLAAALSLNGASRRGTAARLRHPLLSQPVMEACLPLDVVQLTAGGHDRALARAAFSDRLPASVIARQGKGRLTSHYGRLIASGLDELRPLLLEGRLAAEGLLDRAALERMLTVEQLAWRGGYGAIMTGAALELWVRSWEARAAELARPNAGP